MEPGATLRYTGSRPRRRSLESLIKQAGLLSNSGTSNEDTTRHSGQDDPDIDSDQISESSDNSSSSEEDSSSSSEESSESASSGTNSSYQIEPPPPNAPPFFDSADIMEREFRSAFLPTLNPGPTMTETRSITRPAPASEASGASIDEVCGQLQSILSELTTINQKIDSTSSMHSEEFSRIKARAATLGATAVELGRSSINHFGDKLRLTPTPEEFKESHPRQVALLNKMRSALYGRRDNAAPPVLDKIHSVYSGQPSTTAASLPSPMLATLPSEPQFDTIDEYLYNNSTTNPHHSNAASSSTLECRRCRRHYGNASALSQHERVCVVGGTGSPPSFSGSDNSTRHPCRHCGRLMISTALAHHENICIRIFHGRRKHTPPVNELAS